MAKIIVGSVFITLQILSYIGNLAYGNLNFFSPFSIYGIAHFVSYNLVGIIGTLLLLLGIRSIKKNKSEESHSSNNIQTSNIKFCRECGNQVAKDSVFCYKCGKKINRNKLEIKPKITENNNISQFMECSSPLSPVDKLSIDTVLCWQEFEKQANPCFLSKNDLIKFDMILFACFVTRASVICDIKNGFESRMFDAKYIKQVLLGADSLFAKKIDIQEMFNNRIHFYDSIIESKKSMSALVEEFELIIKTDIINDGIYQPFAKNSPLPILDFEDNFRCSLEIKQFTDSYLPNLIQKHLPDVTQYYSY